MKVSKFLFKVPSLARPVPKPLKVTSLARPVPKPLKVPSLARSVLKPLKVPSLVRSVLVNNECGTTPPPKSIVKEVKCK